MIDASQKEFITRFGVDEKVVFKDTSMKGSKGYVSSIEISRNGIYYNICVTQFKTAVKGFKDEFKPQMVQAMDFMLELDEERLKCPK